MYTFSDFGLCCGSLAGADFVTLAESASEAGFRSITLWPTLFEEALAGGLTPSDMRGVLEANGLTVTELDPLCTWLPITTDPADIAARFYAYDEDIFFRMAGELGARSLNVIQATNDPLDRSVVVDALGSLCDRASKHGLLVSVEFMPWSPIGSLAEALSLVGAVARDDVGVNLDTWHHFRSGGSIQELRQLDARSVAAIQISDVEAEPWEEPLRETALARRLPGEGASDTVAVLAALHSVGVRVPLNVEVFSAELVDLPPQEACSRIAESVRNVTLERAGTAPG